MTLRHRLDTIPRAAPPRVEYPGYDLAQDELPPRKLLVICQTRESQVLLLQEANTLRFPLGPDGLDELEVLVSRQLALALHGVVRLGAVHMLGRLTQLDGGVVRVVHAHVVGLPQYHPGVLVDLAVLLNHATTLGVEDATSLAALMLLAQAPLDGSRVQQ